VKVTVSRSEVKGKVQAPPSKSYTIRGLVAASLAKGTSEIINPLSSDDTEACADVLSRVGVHVRREGNTWQVTRDDFHEPVTDLFCGDSAATLRFMTAVGSLIPGKCRLVAGPSLARRPVKPLVEALRQLGVNCSCQGELPPVAIEGGRLRGGTVEIPGDVSSQFISALLFISPFAREGVTIRLTTPLESKPYVLMTLDCLQRFGITVAFSGELDEVEVLEQRYEPTKYEVEGDWSSASYFLALGAVAGEVEVRNINPESLQGDKMILKFLREMGAVVEANRNSVTVRRSRLNPVQADLSDCVDLLPTMAALAAAADGVSEFTGIERARLKESNRVSAIKDGLESMGVKVEEGRNRLTITGSTAKGSRNASPRRTPISGMR